MSTCSLPVLMSRAGVMLHSGPGSSAAMGKVPILREGLPGLRLVGSRHVIFQQPCCTTEGGIAPTRWRSFDP